MYFLLANLNFFIQKIASKTINNFNFADNLQFKY